MSALVDRSLDRGRSPTAVSRHGRRRRSLIAGLTAVAGSLLLAACGAPVASGSAVGIVTASPSTWRWARLRAPAVVWANSALALLRSDDGGRLFTTVLRAPSGAEILSAEAPGPERAAAVVAPIGGGRATLWTTTDAGRRWQRRALPTTHRWLRASLALRASGAGDLLLQGLPVGTDAPEVVLQIPTGGGPLTQLWASARGPIWRLGLSPSGELFGTAASGTGTAVLYRLRSSGPELIPLGIASSAATSPLSSSHPNALAVGRPVFAVPSTGGPPTGEPSTGDPSTVRPSTARPGACVAALGLELSASESQGAPTREAAVGVSTNCGRSWATEVIAPDAVLEEVVPLPGGRIVALVDTLRRHRPRLLEARAGETAWRVRQTSPALSLVLKGSASPGVTFLTSDLGLAYGGAIWRTTDGGRRWREITG